MLASSSRNTLKRAHKDLCTVVSDSNRQPKFTPFPFLKCSRRASSAAVQHSSAQSLRSNPWTFTPSAPPKSAHPRSPLARHNLQLAQHADNGRLIDALRAARDMKNSGVMPDLLTYNHLLAACATDGQPQEASAVFEDMLAMGVQPDLSTFHHLIHANRFLEASAMWAVLEKMHKFDHIPTSVTFSFIIERYIEAENLEMALHFMADLNARGLVPELKIAQGIVALAARLGHPRLALDLAEEFEELSVRRLDNEVWVNCLISSSEALYAEGTRHCWNVVVNDLNIQPDEGVCIAVLHTAARHGLPELAADVLRMLKVIGASWKEYHFAPVVEALCRANKVKDALMMLDIMRTSGISPLTETALPILTSVSRDIDALDATWGMLDEIRQEGKTVDVVALNVLIQAAVSLGDLQRAVGTYKAFGEYAVTPTADTYSVLLSGCVDARHRELGDRLLGEMKEAGVVPDSQTYEQMVALCLTQATYEDAFFYLEEMKTQGHVPGVRAYESIVRKCVSVGDTRYKLAVEEMKECGYRVPKDLQRFIDYRTSSINT